MPPFRQSLRNYLTAGLTVQPSKTRRTWATSRLEVCLQLLLLLALALHQGFQKAHLNQDRKPQTAPASPSLRFRRTSLKMEAITSTKPTQKPDLREMVPHAPAPLAWQPQPSAEHQVLSDRAAAESVAFFLEWLCRASSVVPVDLP